MASKPENFKSDQTPKTEETLVQAIFARKFLQRDIAETIQLAAREPEYSEFCEDFIPPNKTAKGFQAELIETAGILDEIKQAKTLSNINKQEAQKLAALLPEVLLFLKAQYEFATAGMLEASKDNPFTRITEGEEWKFSARAREILPEFGEEPDNTHRQSDLKAAASFEQDIERIKTIARLFIELFDKARVPLPSKLRNALGENGVGLP